jgi:hypothetical protein
MATSQWVTPEGILANLLANLQTSIELVVLDNTDSVLTFSLIGGELPPGLSLSSSGIISGTPTVAVANNYDQQTVYKFIIRVRNANGLAVPDGTFSIIVSNIVNNDFNWITPAGSLGTIPNGQYYSLKLQAESTPAGPITYKLISGSLPVGMRITADGHLQGVPTFLNSVKVAQSEVYKFTVRATNLYGHVTDQTFSVNITNVYGPIIEPVKTDLGTFFDGSYYSQQLSVNELNPNVHVTWSVKEGVLPPGITLSSTGLLSGYIQPIQLIGKFGPAGYDGNQPAPGASGAILQYSEFDYAPYDFNQLNQSAGYGFTIQAFDGANYDLQKYVINIVARSNFTADSSIPVNDTYLSVDSNNVYIPVLLNKAKTLPTGRQDSYYAFKFDGYDYAGDTLTYSIVSNSGTFDGSFFDPLDRLDSNNGLDGSFDHATAGNTNLPGLLLDAQTGWLYGKLNPQSSSLQNYSIGIKVSKTVNNKTYDSSTIYFILPVLGDVNDVIKWITPRNLGTINNGSVSELSVVAHSPLGKELSYSIYDQAGLSAGLPQGLILLPSGDISGRVSFEAFSIDQYTTTFDGGSLTVDRVYNFTVQVSTVDGTATAYQEFILTLDIIDQNPYENLYLTAMPAVDQRQIYSSIVNNAEIFDPNVIYRPLDPWFGINQHIEMLFLPGLTAKTLAEYEDAIVRNHWTKTYSFNDVKTAVVLDEFYKVKYEVVYIEVVDPTENADGKGPGLELNLTNTIANGYIDAHGTSHKLLYPNTSDNMTIRLTSGIGYYDQSSLPPWMTSNQPGASGSSAFNPPLGFVKAVVLAYTKPGTSKLIAYRLKNESVGFKNIDFTVDRYQVDDYYTTNFQSNTWIGGSETTFDALPKVNIGKIVSAVTYAVDVPFNQINGRPIDYIVAHGGIDGVNTFQDGETLIFAQQENFKNAGSYNGWVNYTNTWGGDDITTPEIEGWGSTPYDTYTLVPGYLEKLQRSVISASVVATNVTVDSSNNNIVTVNSTAGVIPGSAIVFAGDSFGGILANESYTVLRVVNNSQIIINNLTVASTIRNEQYNVPHGFTGTIHTALPIDTVTGMSVAVNNTPYILNVDYTYIVSGSSAVGIQFVVNPAENSIITLNYFNKAINQLLTNGSGIMTGQTYTNKRGGIWKINVVNREVFLTPAQDIEVNSRLQILSGKSHSGSVMYYDPILNVGESVPKYNTFRLGQNGVVTPTTFNAGTTKFFSHRDQYYAPGTQDKYLKFPQYGAFN